MSFLNKIKTFFGLRTSEKEVTEIQEVNPIEVIEDVSVQEEQILVPIVEEVVQEPKPKKKPFRRRNPKPKTEESKEVSTPKKSSNKKPKA